MLCENNEHVLSTCTLNNAELDINLKKQALYCLQDMIIGYRLSLEKTRYKVYFNQLKVHYTVYSSPL